MTFGMTQVQQPVTELRDADNAHICTVPWWRFFTNLHITTQSGKGILQTTFQQIGGAGLGALTNGTNFLIPSMPRAGTLVSVSAYTTAGTATVDVKIDGVDVTSLNALAATTTSKAPVVATGANAIAIASVVTAVVSAASVGAGQALIIQCNYTIP